MERRSISPSENSSSYYRSRHYSRNRRSKSRSSRDRSRDRGRSRRSRSRSREPRRRSPDVDLYRDLINQDHEEKRDRYRRSEHSKDRGGEKDRRNNDSRYNKKREYSPNTYLDEISNDSDDTIIPEGNYYNQTPSNNIIVCGLPKHITEADIAVDLKQFGLQPASIRLIRRKRTGASRGFAFVEFRTVEEATRWMETKQGMLMLLDQFCAVMQYSATKEREIAPPVVDKYVTDWHCGKCGVFNFKRRKSCFKCNASREESEKGGEGSDEVSNILTKKIILRNLDVLTNEESVLVALQNVVPALVSKISKILICRDHLTSTSRGICYLCFDNLVDSMNTHNALKALEPPLKIDDCEVLISYCIDSENRTIIKPATTNTKPVVSNELHRSTAVAGQFTLADVPRLAEYSARMYAMTPADHSSYIKYYTQYYMQEITKGQFGNLPTAAQLGGGDTANSGAAVAQSALQRIHNNKQAYNQPLAPVVGPVAPPVVAPKGNDGKIYPTPDVSQYQYDDTSGYYYDPTTGLYFDAHSQYYFNNETNSYLYWDPENSTYTLMPQAGGSNTRATLSTVEDDPSRQNDERKDPNKKEYKHDKVKVAKKIVKDMEKWAKQLNQKKDMMQMPMSSVPVRAEEIKVMKPDSNGYADVGFSILEKKEKVVPQKFTAVEVNTQQPQNSKLVPSYGSDSENEQEDSAQRSAPSAASEKDYVDFEKLTCLLCKRAFQSLEILSKHLKMSTLHKENLQKFNLTRGSLEMSADAQAALNYRDRAKERRLKYGEVDAPPINKSKERFQREMEKQASAVQVTSNLLAATPIGENNVGNRLLQKMGWTEGQGLGRSNQGRTNIIEAESRSANAGLGSKTTSFAPGDDYKSYIKRMMKSRYESVN